MNDQPIAHLLQLYFNGSITPEQKEILAGWIQEHGGTEQFEQLMQQSWRQFQPAEAVAGDKAGEWWQHILAEANAAKTITMETKPRGAWMRWAAAAVLLFAVGGLWLVVGRRGADNPPVVKTPVIHDVLPPAASKAVLTLANGQQITLDSAANGTLALQGATNVVKLADGELKYSRESGVGSRESMQYNTLSVPAGSRITGITLSDGTRVLLNAASSITYPVAFTGAVRKVNMTGEVYFEVASLALTLPTGREGTRDNSPASYGKVPFIVNVNGKQEVEVLGTHFNINAYDDEENIKTTLLEGKVKVSATQPQTSNYKPQKVLQPGEQAQLTTNNTRPAAGGELQTTNNIDIDEVMAWKKGMFLYKGTDIKTIMREVARTYNVGITYESVSNEKFYAEVSRNTNVSNLLKMLELTGDVHFKVQGNQVTVLK
jgi:transmembrane sensor